MIAKFCDKRDWFFEKRFGLFIHWGLYSIHGLQEQEQQRYGVPAREYAKLVDSFNPGEFDPNQWLDLAEKVGMEYMVFTTKHHDGFCLWDTQLSDFKITNSPYGRDVLARLADACHSRSMPLELYYSVVDWHHPAYPNIGRHHEIVTDTSKHDLAVYLEYLKGQVRELCTNYGEIHGIWWDMNVPELHAPEIHEMIRCLQPSAVINNRGFGEGDYSTPERDFDPEGANPDEKAFHRPTEACQSVGVNSWGFRVEEDYYSIKYFQRKLSETLPRGGNYLLNVGPDAEGKIPDCVQKILGGVGLWYSKTKEALTAIPCPGILKDRSVLTTCRDGNILYVICPDDLENGTLSLYPMKGKPVSVSLLNDGTSIPFSSEPIIYYKSRGEELRLRHIPVDCMNSEVLVFKIVFPEKIQ